MRVGDTFSLDLDATGNPTPTYSATNLPSGVSINSTTGVISGEFDTIQTLTTTVTATNSEGMDTVTIEFTIQAELTIPVFSPSTQPAVSASIGDTFSLDLNATGNPTPTYSASNLPPGLSINTTTGVISGTFTNAETSTTTVTATNSEGMDTVTIAFTIQTASRLYFVNDASDTVVAYDYSGTRQSADDISLGSGQWQGGLATHTRLYFVRTFGNIAYCSV